MAFSSKLCNPTPFKVELNWDRGVDIIIEPFGSTELTMQQMDDFRPGKPGSPEVKRTLDYFGVFLLDADRPYDHQALDACTRSHDAKKSQYDATLRNLRDSRAATGVAPNEEAFEETLDQLGYVTMRKDIAILKQAMVSFQKAVGDQPEASLRTQLDPRRTVFVTDPPRQFASVAAMEFFLSQNPEIKAQHTAFTDKSKDQFRPASVPSEETQPELPLAVSDGTGVYDG